jgi:hypothetical protein
MDKARRVLAAWHRAECVIAVLCFSFIAAIMMADVLGREVLARLLDLLGIDHGPTGVFGAQRMSILALVVGAYAGIGIATATGAHLRPRLADGWIPKDWGPAMDRLADVITGVFLVGSAWVAFLFVRQSFEIDERTMVLDWLVWPYQAAIPLGFLSAAGRYFVFAAYPALRPQAADIE